MSLVVGLTGGIGSGKTAASDAFARRGITVVDADLAARIVVEPGRAALAAIAARHGPQILRADGNLDRARLREIVFQDPEERRWLEALTHPLIREEISQQLRASTSPYTLLVSPLLFESGQHQLVHRALVIDVPEVLQSSRASQRDGVSTEQIHAIIRAQMPREERLRRADDVLVNTGSPDDLERLVDDLHQRYIALARGKPA